MKHEKIEKNAILMVVLILAAISFGGLAEIVPLLFQKQTTHPAKGLKPWPALVLEGRDIYIREGCHVCHTQMVRALLSDTLRYGPYNRAEDDVYEHPFLWGSKRTGPDIANLGGRYSDDWHHVHLMNPRNVVPASPMPAYPWLDKRKLTGKDTAKKMRALRVVGVPYTNADIKGAQRDVMGKTEMQALIAYLQQLGLNRKANNNE